MIVVECILKSAISADRDDSLCRVEIANDLSKSLLTHGARGDYTVRLYSRGNGRLIRTARVENWPRNARPAWRLIQAAFKALGE